MKKFLTIIGFLFSLSTFAQDGSNVVNALKEGNASKFSGYFNSNVDVKLPQKNEMKNANKADAAAAVADFFSTGKINSFDVTSQREMGGTMYIAGKLKSDAKSYNLTVMLKDNTVITVRIN